MLRVFLIAMALASGAQQTTEQVPQDKAAVRVITSDADRKACQYLGLVSVRKALGPNKAGGALKKALDRVAQMGGNGLFLINQSQDWANGASVSGEALRCPQGIVP